jgi:hypothetical protein
MKRAEPGMFTPVPGELDPPADQAGQRNPIPQFVEEAGRQRHGSAVSTRCRRTRRRKTRRAAPRHVPHRCHESV